MVYTAVVSGSGFSSCLRLRDFDLLAVGVSDWGVSVTLVDGFERSGRKRVEAKLPNLLADIKSLVDAQSQTDPSLT